MVDAMMFMLPSVNDEIHRLLKERRLADALDVNFTLLARPESAVNHALC